MDRNEFQKLTVNNIVKNYEVRLNSLALLATGVGKTKVAIEFLAKIVNKINKQSRILFVVPTEILRDVNVPNEFKKFRRKALYDLHVDSICYDSLVKLNLNVYDIIILDEVHNLTLPMVNYLLTTNSFLLGLTGTEPRRKPFIVDMLKFDIVGKMSLDEAVENKFVSNYEIKVVFSELNLNEKIMYKRLSRICELEPTEQNNIKRANFLYRLDSKFEVGTWIYNNLISKDDRAIIFCGSIEHTKKICSNVYHSKSGKKALNDMIDSKINHIACVNALNEGITIPNLNKGILLKVNSNEKNLLQQLGRLLRGDDQSTLYIVCSKGTQEEVWLNSILTFLNNDKINKTTYEELKNEKIK